jgi:hypothetical protein
MDLINVAALSLMAELSGYLGLFLGFSLLQISGLLTFICMHFRYNSHKKANIIFVKGLDAKHWI